MSSLNSQRGSSSMSSAIWLDIVRAVPVLTGWAIGLVYVQTNSLLANSLIPQNHNVSNLRAIYSPHQPGHPLTSKRDILLGGRSWQWLGERLRVLRVPIFLLFVKNLFQRHGPRIKEAGATNRATRGLSMKGLQGWTVKRPCTWY